MSWSSASHCRHSRPQQAFVKGYMRGFDVRTGKRIWIFHTVPRTGEFGNETWENDSWSYTGNTGVWAGDDRRRGTRLRLSADRRRRPTTTTADIGPATDLFGESLVCLDAKTGKRVWHFQLVHHGIWDFDLAGAADPRRHHRRWAADQGGRAGHQAGVHLRVRSGHRTAGLADRGAAGAAVGRARRKVLADAAVSDQTARVRPAGRRRSTT